MKGFSKMSSIQRVVSSIASVVRGRDYYGRYEKMYDRSLMEIPSFKLLSDLAHGKILDVGCGVGYLSTLFPDYVGVDSSKEALALAKKRTRREYIVSDAMNLPFHTSTFDSCISYDSIEHMKSIDRAVSEMKRVSNKVVLSYVDFNSYYRFFAYDKSHVNIPASKEITSLLAKYFTHVRMFESSGIFKIPRFLNAFLGRYLPNQVVFEAFINPIFTN
jgi:ubiquinone/menaquinone biosynthesis C-methylase UbiE